MAQMNVSIPEALKQWAEQRVAEGRYASTSDYVRDLVRRDQDAATELAWLQAEIDKGIASGLDSRSYSRIVQDIRAKYLSENG
ncbi:type II toxin-antitoxin system ParD family antitoxin [soil metagenome]|jgi:antitoxin ParD1/3/4